MRRDTEHAEGAGLQHRIGENREERSAETDGLAEAPGYIGIKGTGVASLPGDRPAHREEAESEHHDRDPGDEIGLYHPEAVSHEERNRRERRHHRQRRRRRENRHRQVEGAEVTREPVRPVARDRLCRAVVWVQM